MLIVLWGQEAPPLKRYAHDFQIACLDDIRKRPFHLSRCRWLCLAVQPERQRAEVPCHLYGTETEGRGLETWNGLELLAHLPPNGHDVVRRGDRDGKRYSRYQHIVGVEAGIHAQDCGQAANHQSRSNQQDEGERDFNDDENALSAMVRTTRTRSS